MRTILVALVLLAPTRLLAVELPALGFDSFRTETPQIGFDVPARLVCQDVTTAEFRSLHPGERLVEVVAPVTLALYHGAPQRVDDVIVELRSTNTELQVHDYTPRTELTSELARPIEVTHTRATDKSIGASLGGKLSGDAALTPTISTGADHTEASVEKQSKLPPKRAVIVSGTLGSRTGVYFKLRRSTQSTLEGERTFRVTFRAPADWEEGKLEVRCLARGQRKWLFVDQRQVWKQTARPIELKLASHEVEAAVAP